MFELMPYDRRRHAAMYDPWNAMEDFEKSVFGGDMVTAFKTDIKDTGDAFVLEADMPGFDKKDIKLELNGDSLTISAERNEKSEEKDKKGNYIRRERSYGSYSRSFDVSGIDTEKIGAEYRDGVLKLTMPKRGEAEKGARHIKIN